MNQAAAAAHPRFRRAAIAALLAVGAAAALAIALAPAGPRAFAAAERCNVPDELASHVHRLPRFAAAVAAGGPLTIVALGSSSTFGTGASGPDKNYPSRLAEIMAAHYAGRAVHVFNRGVGGDEAPGMLARLERDVLPLHPDLVIWQVGTNSVLRDRGPAEVGAALREGIERIEAAGADVMLMNLQYAPAVLQHAGYRDMLHELDAVARLDEVPMFRRFAMMRYWAETGRMPLAIMLSRDRLHMSDASYDCIARQLDATLDAIARRTS